MIQKKKRFRLIIEKKINCFLFFYFFILVLVSKLQNRERERVHEMDNDNKKELSFSFKKKNRQNEMLLNLKQRASMQSYRNNRNINIYIEKDKYRAMQNILPMNIRAATNSHQFSNNLCIKHHTRKESQKQRKYIKKDAETVNTGETERKRPLERKVSEYSKDAYLLRMAQDKPEPLIDHNKNQPMQQLFRFWGKMNETG